MTKKSIMNILMLKLKGQSDKKIVSSSLQSLYLPPKILLCTPAKLDFFQNRVSEQICTAHRVCPCSPTSLATHY